MGKAVITGDFEKGLGSGSAWLVLVRDPPIRHSGSRENSGGGLSRETVLLLGTTQRPVSGCTWTKVGSM